MWQFELVEEIKIYDKDQDGVWQESYTTKKGLNYSGLITVLLKAIQEQQVQIEDLKTRVIALENR